MKCAFKWINGILVTLPYRKKHRKPVLLEIRFSVFIILFLTLPQQKVLLILLYSLSTLQSQATPPPPKQNLRD